MKPNKTYIRRVIAQKCKDFRVTLEESLVAELVAEYAGRDWPSDAAVENDIADAVRELGEPR